MMFVLGALVIAAAVAWGSMQGAAALKARNSDSSRARLLEIFATFAPASSAAAEDPRAILVWEPLARTARRLFPEEFEQLDRAAGVAFPFGRERIEAAHAQWTADWLAWEAAHDAEFKSKAAIVQEELASATPSASARAR